MHAIKFFFLTFLLLFQCSLSFAEEATESSTLIVPPSELNTTETQESSVAENAIAEVKEEIIAELANPYLLNTEFANSQNSINKQWQSLLLDFGIYLDTSGNTSISQIVQGGLSQFIPYSDFAFKNEQGTTWLYLSVPNFEVASNSHVYIELGSHVQGTSTVWYKTSEGDLLLIPPLPQNKDGHSYIVKDFAKGGELFIKLEGVPSLWFNPAIKIVTSTSDISDNGIFNSDKYEFYLLITLTVLSILSFLRFLTEKGEWRFWASIFGFATVVLYYFGIPATPNGEVINSDLGALFALAALLFSLVTLGRQMMSLSHVAKGMNSVFLILSLLGVLLGLAPFSTSFTWLTRYIDFWQISVIVILIPTFILSFNGIIGSITYLACLLALFIGAAVGFYGINGGLNSSLYALAPQVGAVLALFILLITPSNTKANSKKIATGEAYSPDMDYTASDTDIASSLDMQSSKENKAEHLDAEKQSLISEHKEVEDSAEIYFDNSINFSNPQTFARIEQAFRVPLDSFMRELCFLEQQIDFVQGVDNQNHKEKALVHTQTLLSVGKDINMLANSLPKMLSRKQTNSSTKIPFNLQDVLRQVYEKVRYEAASSQIALSWFRSPHVGLWYVGDKNSLATLLYQLLSDSIRATKQGIVYIRVERDDASNNNGRLIFIIGDSGAGNPPQGRAASLLSKVWELTSSHNGTFNVESSEQGTEYRFILEFKALEDDGVTEKPMPNLSCTENPIHNPKLVHVTSPEAFERHMLAFRLERMNLQLIESMDLDDALQQYKATPSAIVIIGSDYSLVEISSFTNSIREFEKEKGLQETVFIGLYTIEQAEWHAYELQSMNCSYTLQNNERRLVFRTLIEKILNGEKPNSIYADNLDENPSSTSNETLSEESLESGTNTETHPQAETIQENNLLSLAPKAKSKKNSSRRAKKEKFDKPKVSFALSLHAEDDENIVEEIEIINNNSTSSSDPFYIDNEQEIELPSFINPQMEETDEDLIDTKNEEKK